MVKSGADYRRLGDWRIRVPKDTVPVSGLFSERDRFLWFSVNVFHHGQMVTTLNKNLNYLLVNPVCVSAAGHAHHPKV